MHVAWEIALAEHLRQLAIHGIHRRAIGLVQFQRSHVALSKIAVVCHVPAELDGLPLQIVPNFQQLRAVLRQLRGVVHNGLCHGLGVGHQILHRHVPLHHSLGKRVHLALHVRVFHIAAVLADEILPQLFHVPQHHGRFLADAHLAFQLLYPLLQRLVLLGQRVSLLLEIPRLALHPRRCFQRKPRIFHAVDGIQSGFFIAACVFDHPNTGVFQRCLYLCAGVVRDDRRQHLIKSNGSLWLRLKIPRRHIGNILCQPQHFFRCVRFNLQRGVSTKFFVNSRHSPFCTQRLYNSRRRIV